ncbi:hypothetical protein GW17_00035542 [Ensete ventricosum]|nr:hypothetical protein GW17_00035542 [Ensete ventricosum]
MAIGLEGHFGTPDIAYMRSALDKLAGANVPIWLTEVDVAHPNQAKSLEEVLREAYSHPAVQGIVIWGAWHPEGCWRMCLTDNNFKNLPAGDVVDKLIFEWRSANVAATTDADGLLRAELFHGEYKITINHPSSNSSSVQSLTVDSASQNTNVLRLGLVRLRWTSYQYEYLVALEHFKVKYTELEVDGDPFTNFPKDDNMPLAEECLAEPLRAQYGGGIVRNPEFNDGLKGWSVFGLGQIAERTSDTGNRFLATDRRSLSHQSMSQKVYLQRGMLYTFSGIVTRVDACKHRLRYCSGMTFLVLFSAWLQVDQGNTTVTAIFKTAEDGLVPVGAAEARSGCWSMLKGGLTAKSSGPAEFFFEVTSTALFR